MKPVEYYSQERPEVVPFVPATARRVLDVGCAEGRFGANLKKADPSREVWGIEIDPKAAASARNRLDRVIETDVTRLSEALPAGHFDCIMFIDSLEHFAEPETVIGKLKPALAPNGVMVFSIPNVRYLYNLWNLVIGKDWKYEDAGILDRTHLRFFTHKSLKRFFDELGFNVVKLEGINGIQSWKFDFLNSLSLGWLSDTRYTQFVCVVQPR